MESLVHTVMDSQSKFSPFILRMNIKYTRRCQYIKTWPAELDQFQSHSQRLGEWTWQNINLQLSMRSSLMLYSPRCNTTPCPVRQRRELPLVSGTSLNYRFWFLSSRPGILPWSPLKRQTQMITGLCRNFGRSIAGLYSPTILNPYTLFSSISPSWAWYIVLDLSLP